MMTFSFVKSRNIWFAFSGLLVVLSIAALSVWGLQLGIDFTGGSMLEVGFEQAPAVSAVRQKMGALGFEAQVQTAGAGMLIRLRDVNEEEHQKILADLESAFGKVNELKFDSIGPVIGDELRRTAIIGVIVALALIGLYIAWAFRKVSYPVAAWKYGVMTIVAAFHDVIIPLGVFAVLGHFYGWEVGSAFVAAILTILGYSINDTIVVLDRTRENLSKHVRPTFEEIVDLSIHQTLARSLNTTITTLLALAAIFFFGGETTKPFALALLIGIAFGAYSSIFLASTGLAAWERKGNRG